MIVANDLGFGQDKLLINDEKIKQDTVVSPISENVLEKVDHTDKVAVKNAVANLMNQLDVSIDNKRYLVGNFSSRFSLDRETMDINELKAKSNLTKILPLSYIAAKAVQDAYAHKQDIFNPLVVNPIMATSLPITEIVQENQDVRTDYGNRFNGKSFVVLLNTFDQPINVTINFAAADVWKEGEVAIAVAVKYGSDELRESIIKSIQTEYPDRADEAENIVMNSTDILGIDIGQGTIDLPLISANSADTINSTSIKMGFGTVLKSAFKTAPRINEAFRAKDILDFTRIVNADPETLSTPLQKKHEVAVEAVKKNIPTLIHKIKAEVSDMLRTNPELQIIYVFGGGSIPVNEYSDLKRQLKDLISKNMSDAVVVWVDQKYAQDLNVIGLNYLAKMRAKKMTKAKN